MDWNIGPDIDECQYLYTTYSLSGEGGKLFERIRTLFGRHDYFLNLLKWNLAFMYMIILSVNRFFQFCLKKDVESV